MWLTKSRPRENSIIAKLYAKIVKFNSQMKYFVWVGFGASEKREPERERERIKKGAYAMKINIEVFR